MRRLLVPTLALVLAACTVGPDYEKPPAPVSVKFKELEGWKPATPHNAASDMSWWAIYDDPVLDGLEDKVSISNQTLKADEAAFREAVAVVAESQAQFFPTVTGATSAQRISTPVSSSSTSSASRGGGGGFATTIVQNEFSVSPTASWTPDIWGKIRRTVESNVANAQASASDLAAARLSAQGTLATDYLELRVLDDEQRVLRDSVAEYQRSLDMNEENPYAHYLTGLALMALGCDQQAHDEWRNAEALRPQDEQGAWAIRMARRLLDHGQ